MTSSRKKAEAFTLDTSAFLTLWNDEEGADEVEAILRRAESGDAKVYYSFMTMMELYYNIKRRLGDEKAREVYDSLRYLPAEAVWPDERLLIAAGDIKAGNSLSVADAWIAATAMAADSILVHKDPEYNFLEKQKKLE